ncbi:concanavalin A-like lectin/glucanase [Ceraceosorus guamensis]|uniref:Concanavalin A-like lectin/glucanase n=1 Tax=Ceraceosorus guamensis TaxID=1522189 RepID=A0A316VYM4_9BASI|nr:concanavalin A-like lectin/glucanase [Ceraceosorus guamensis]PWN42600.1 concanavalin A-like lectin/glucanase [Ceraceosorus guamensis]
MGGIGGRGAASWSNAASLSEVHDPLPSTSRPAAHKSAKRRPGLYSSLKSTYSHSASRPYAAVPGDPHDQRSPLHCASAGPEADDFLHHSDYRRGYSRHFDGGRISLRGLLNVGTLIMLVLGLLGLFAGYPILAHFDELNGQIPAGVNGSGQLPIVVNALNFRDHDTPPEAWSWKNPDGEDYHLVFSDEFEVPGRTFWPGDDPYWEAVDIWYGATKDYEWYMPEQINTTSGYLQITMSDRPAHDLNFRSAMLQSWNKFCFQGGFIEYSAILPGSPDTQGWWPGAWLSGNLGRPGYLGTTEGTWPYSYSGCDTGIRPNQTTPDGLPESISTAKLYGKTGLSWLPGMRYSSCTCPGEDHPGPSNDVARAAPEIDGLEAQTQKGVGQASQSLQVAAFDVGHKCIQNAATIYDESVTHFNDYTGDNYQQAQSGVSNIPEKAYELADNPTFTKFGLEYSPDLELNGGGFLTWYVDGKPTWRMDGKSMPANADIGVGQRHVPTEPMSIVINFGISQGFQNVVFDTLNFPATMKVDYVRVYQKNGQPERVSCSPPDHPTSDFIERHKDVYYNPNVTVWPKAWPKNSLVDGC